VGRGPPDDVPAHRYPSPISHRSSDHNIWYRSQFFPSPFHRVYSCDVRPQHTATTTSPPCVRHIYAVAHHHTSTSARIADRPAPTRDPSRAARRPTQRLLERRQTRPPRSNSPHQHVQDRRPRRLSRTSEEPKVDAHTKTQALSLPWRIGARTIKDFGARTIKTSKTLRCDLPHCKRGPVYNPAHIAGSRP
jgi:hypothetical protein